MKITLKLSVHSSSATEPDEGFEEERDMGEVHCLEILRLQRRDGLTTHRREDRDDSHEGVAVIRERKQWLDQSSHSGHGGLGTDQHVFWSWQHRLGAWKGTEVKE